METYEHLRLPIAGDSVERQKKSGGGYTLPPSRSRSDFSRQAIQKADAIKNAFTKLKAKFSGSVTPSLIYEIKINQSVSPEGFEKTLASMGIHVLSVAENKKGYWVVFADDENLTKFKTKLKDYGQEEGHSYDFFNAIESFQDIPIEKKIGKGLKNNPLGETADFIDIELWKMTDPQKNEDFIEELKQAYSDQTQFRITDKLIARTFVLLRVKLTKATFDEIIELKEISRADRPSIPQFNPFDYTRPDISEIKILEPEEDATGILIIDSGIVSNHPMLEKCIGSEENFQSGEKEMHDTIGHGTAVAGCAAYGDIKACIDNKEFSPSNWIFSAKIMYAEGNDITGTTIAVYAPEKLVEHQFKNAVESFLSNANYHIRVVNISLGNSNEVWHKNYNRQLPLAALIDEMAFTYPDVVFIVSSGNQDPLNESFETIEGLKNNYPAYLTENRVGFGINGMIKPELVEYGGNRILFNNYGRISEDRGGKIVLLNNQTTDDIFRYDYGTSFSAPKVAHLAGRIANRFPQRSGNFLKNMMLVGAGYPFEPNKDFYSVEDKKKAEIKHLSICGFGLSEYGKAVNSYSHRTVLWDEGQIGLNQVKAYSLQLPDIFFTTKGKKKIIVTLTFNPETRLTRGDSYLGNRMEFHLFHSINPQVLIEKYGVISEDTEKSGVPEDLKKFEIDLFPGPNIRKAGCHQKAWKKYKNEPKNRPASPISLVLLNFNKWITDVGRIQGYCISVTFEHEKEIELYNEIRTNIQTRVRI